MDNVSSAERTPEYDEIIRVVQLYVDGFEDGMDKLREAFHEDAWIFAIDEDGDLSKGLVSERFERWAASYRPVSGRVISVVQAGSVASVLLGFDNTESLSDSWVDVLALIKLNGVWKITHKSAVHSSRASWAKPA
ncbi:nuclear transport factor 2 family protein [Halomonas sp. McH1-25]|uniref:nuclear transport factor 2 family protein n=1 Tax=unclassified Halomonas TaxID=2609666 RepID=UPI001EF41677|nr:MULTISPECIES: nuclear transport factor 2 family protein [unclassified Halomonas]MCG7602256.1 nuclear transport factor 2 family protein [Halomonas sp. McH1-25]MCP1344718.1 nuclear transport factor 2 family protein [Halomonas sp. FL8]MCP1363318.1 nuclear transport factor 2 family protein [Halomonas sp. BBD45]MCP1364090.1 nuclear transport factor 2 family protein [Halomonas sp. BBD48]